MIKSTTSLLTILLCTVTALSTQHALAQSASAPAFAPTTSNPLATPEVNYSGFMTRPEVRDFVADLQSRLGIPASEVSAALSQATPVPTVIDLIKPPANPGVRSWQRYRSRFLDHIRIAGGKRFLEEHALALASAEEKYGVPKEIITAIIGVETIYGRNAGNFNTVSALATLAFDYPPRAELFRKELESLFLLAHERKIDPMSIKGSYAGAIGLPQFLPSSIRAFAVDFDNDGSIDLRSNPTDAIGSVGSYLMQYGWQRGERVVVKAHVPQNTDPASVLAAGYKPSFSATQLRAAGVQFAEGAIKDTQSAALIDFVTPGSNTEFWLGLQNFYAITRYNHSSFYAMAVNDLAEAFKLPEERLARHTSPRGPLRKVRARAHR